MPVSLPVEGVVDDDRFRRHERAVRGDEKPARQGPRVGVDEPGPPVETLADLRCERTVGLEVVELAGGHPGDEDAPDVSPAIGGGVERDHLRRLGVGHLVIEENAHAGRRMAVDHELDPRPTEHGSVGEGMAELEGRARSLGVGPPRRGSGLAGGHGATMIPLRSGLTPGAGPSSIGPL